MGAARHRAGLDARRYRRARRCCKGGVPPRFPEKGHDATQTVTEHALVGLAEVVAVLGGEDGPLMDERNRTAVRTEGDLALQSADCLGEEVENRFHLSLLFRHTPPKNHHRSLPLHGVRR